MRDKMADVKRTKSINLPEETWRWLGLLADNQKRSISAQIEFLLDEHLGDACAAADVKDE